MADYIFTQNGDNKVQIGDMTGMPYHVNTALKWALEHNFLSVAAQYSKTLALEIVRLREDNERMYAALELAQRRAAAYEDTGLTPDEIAALRAENDGYKADIEAGRLVPVSYICGTIDNAVRVSVSPECGTVIEYESGRVRSIHPKWFVFRDFESMDDLNAALEGGQQ